MQRRLIPIFIALLVVTFSFYFKLQDSEFTTIIMVRHAEKELTGDDPMLTQAGIERAEALAYFLKDIDIDAVYDTPYNRTRLTAKPVADAKGIPLQTVTNLRGEGLKAAIDEICEKYKGKTVLMTSHSNVVPVMIKLVKNEPVEGVQIEMINESIYDNIYFITFNKRENAKVFHLKYGAHSSMK